MVAKINNRATALKTTDNQLEMGSPKPSSVLAPQTSQQLNKQINEALDALYRKHNSSLRAFISQKLNSNEEIDDVIQEVYYRLIRHPRLNELELSFSLLCKIAANIIIDCCRKEKVRAINTRVSFDELEIKSPMPSPEQMLNSKEGIAIIRDAIQRLDKKSRQAIILHRFKGMTYKKIGKEMGISISMVRKHIVKALRQISKEVEESYEKRA
ncbi:MAG: sigma-70 family RNA polymerase sigma factor [Deltaproteobacteria bacterium]|nr:sigma-70 family RNA polymerase sigma factor [Deltaproteobacteria bacterium]